MKYLELIYLTGTFLKRNCRLLLECYKFYLLLLLLASSLRLKVVRHGRATRNLLFELGLWHSQQMMKIHLTYRLAFFFLPQQVDLLPPLLQLRLQFRSIRLVQYLECIS